MMLFDFSTGGVDGGTGNAQRRPRRANVLEPEHQHIPRPAVGERAGDARRGPAALEQVRDRLRDRPAAGRRRR